MVLNMNNKEIKTLFDCIITEDSFFEVRILHTKKSTLSGYFNDSTNLLKAVNQYDGKYNIFFTLNSVIPDVVSRSKNHFTEWSKNTTTDKEIIQRDWILIDLDPERPAGISSTDEELSYAKELAEKVENFLDEQGFSQPVKCMSGNGYHLLYPISLENTPENTTLIKDFLIAIDKKFSNKVVKVDTSTYNAARITKLYGTIACKGDNTESRPHRRSCIISAPEILENNSVELIRGIIALCNPISKENKKNVSSPVSSNIINAESNTPSSEHSQINIREFCEAHEIAISHEKTWCDGICYILATCPWNPDHTDKSAYIIEFPNGKITAGCHHDSCSGENWRTLLQKFPDMKEFLQPPKKKLAKKDDNMSAAEVLLADIKESGHKLYHDTGETAYVSVPLENSACQYMAVQDKSYKQLLRRIYYQRYGKAISTESLKQVTDTLEAEANFQGAQIQPSIRCKYLRDKILYYLADEEQTTLCIDKKGIHILPESPIPFIRTNNMLEQVMPMDREKKEGKKKPTFRALAKKYWNFQSADDLMLHNVTLLTRFFSDIPCPIMYYRGDRGSAKTTSMRLDKVFLDPSHTDVMALPSTINDIISILSGSYSVAFDNIEGGISADLANIFCICSTSGFYSKRKLFTDNDTINIQLHTHLSFSGITMLSNRADILDRCIHLSSVRIPDSKRRTESEIIAEFKHDLPYLLYRGMKILSKALIILENLELPNLPRMGDFARIGYAIAEAMNYGGNHFLEVYRKNQEELLEISVEDDILLSAIVSFIKEANYFHGTMTELQAALIHHSSKTGIDGKSLTKASSSLSKKLFQSQSVLQQFGIYLDRGKSNGKRYIEIWIEGKEDDTDIITLESPDELPF